VVSLSTSSLLGTIHFPEGTNTSHFRKGSGKIVRYCMQQLEEMGIIEVDEKTGGRRLTPEGQREMDTVAVQVAEMEEESDDE
jgi:small subunit ribosomal protein S19e